MKRVRLARKHVKGQDDHVDAWLMSYADLITLLFMFFVIMVSIATTHTKPDIPTNGEEKMETFQERFGYVTLNTSYADIYRRVVGAVSEARADRDVAVEQTDRGVWIDLSTVQFFAPGSADIPADQLAVIHKIAQALVSDSLRNYRISVEGYTSDAPSVGGSFANNWELAAMRAAKVVGVLVEEGIAPSRLRATSFGANNPVVPNADVEGNPIVQNRARNERVVIRLEKLGEE